MSAQNKSAFKGKNWCSFSSFDCTALHCMVTGTSTGSMHPTNSYVEAGAAGIWGGCNGSRQIVPGGPSIWANCSGPNCPRSNLPRTSCNGRSAPSYFSQSILFYSSSCSWTVQVQLPQRRCTGIFEQFFISLCSALKKVKCQCLHQRVRSILLQIKPKKKGRKAKTNL